MMFLANLLGLSLFFPSATWALQAHTASGEISASGRKAVWIKSHMRSGSSTILSMISATLGDNQNGTDVFSLFEPCHKQDKYKDRMSKLLKEDISHCSDLVSMFAECDFSEVEDGGLHNWANPHTSNDHTTQFNRKTAEELCKKSKLVAVKTVWPMPTPNISWVLDVNPHMKIIEVIRDPRGMLASHLSGNGDRDASSIDEYCEHFAEDAKVKHNRLHRVVFEDLVTNPRFVSKGVYKFLELPWGEKQEDWVRKTFNAECDGGEDGGLQGEERHHDCHSNSQAVKSKWKQDLSSEQKKHFTKNEACQHVAHLYKFEN